MYTIVNIYYCGCILLEVLDKRRVDHCLISMEGLAEGKAGALLASGEVSEQIFGFCFFTRFALLVGGLIPTQTIKSETFCLAFVFL